MFTPVNGGLCLGQTTDTGVPSNNLRSAQQLITALKAAPADEDDLNFAASLLEIDYMIRTQDLSRAFELVNDLFGTCNAQPVPSVYQRIRLLSTKTRLFALAGKPQKGFSISLRAVVVAQRSRNVYALPEAVDALAGVLNGLEQYEKAFQLIDSARGRVCFESLGGTEWGG